MRAQRCITRVLCLFAQEMVEYMTSVFGLMLATRPEFLAKSGLSVEEIAQATAEQCFDQADANGDGDITYDEFQEWYLQGGGSKFLDSVNEKATGEKKGATSKPRESVFIPVCCVSVCEVCDKAVVSDRSISQGACCRACACATSASCCAASPRLWLLTRAHAASASPRNPYQRRQRACRDG